MKVPSLLVLQPQLPGKLTARLRYKPSTESGGRGLVQINYLSDGFTFSRQNITDRLTKT